MAWNIFQNLTSVIVDSNEMNKESHLDKRKWQMGNTRKRRQLIQHFGKTSSLHGMEYMCSAGKHNAICASIMYRLFFAACFLLMAYSVVSLLRENLGKQSTFINTINRDTEVGMEEDPGHFPLFPRVTICRMPFYKTDFNSSDLQLVQYVMLSLGIPFSPLTVQEMNMVVLLALRKLNMVQNLTTPALDLAKRLAQLEHKYNEMKATANHFDLKQFIYEYSLNCSEFFVSCHLLMFTRDCCEMFEPVLTSVGLCFTLRDIQSIVKYVVGHNSEVMLLVDLPTPTLMTQRSEVGFRVFLTDPFEDAPVIFNHEDGVDIVPSLTTTIKTQLVMTHRVALHTPWHGLWSTCPKRWYNDTLESDRYTHNSCSQDQNTRLIREKCECEPLIHTRSSTTLRLCDPIDWYECFIQSSIQFDVEEFASACGQACVVYSYKAEPSIMGFGGDGSISRVGIMHNSKQYTYNEYRKTTISNMLSQIGGSLGLYLGASIITVMEIIAFIAAWMWYKLAPAKHPTKSAKVHTTVLDKRGRETIGLPSFN